MRMLSRVQNGLLALLALIGALAILTLMIHVVTDVVLRNTVNTPIPATYEIVTNYYMVALAFIPLAWVERGGGMVQVEVIDPFLNDHTRHWSDRLVALISTVIYAGLTWVTFLTAMKNFKTGTFVMAQNVSLPTWPAYYLPPLGFALATLIVALRIIQPKAEPKS
ncbi:TRAP transporter small permease [Oricola sp.]|uniref:TRAP transporter small permease n=1 Tax=Oricola sp. TaxID=1979950 RepID=UPI0025FBD7AC|nr:TRAP transporter small permease [Oricola sp.]MCI5077066.1 TRAP transporter small permease [Oricola sp.]